MAFSFYIKPPLTLSSYSPIKSRSSQQVNGKVFLGLSPNRHKCLSHPFSRLYHRPGGWTWAAPWPDKPQEAEEQPRVPISMWVRRGVSTAGWLLPPWCSADVCSHLGLLWLSARSSASWEHQSTRREIISDCYKGTATKAVSGLLFHFGICFMQHYSSSTETS